MKILLAYGIPEVLVSLIDGLYPGTKARVVKVDGTTDLFDILAGVLQGVTLAPYLLIILIDYIMTVTMEEFESEP